jgi:hypothetical protein
VGSEVARRLARTLAPPRGRRFSGGASVIASRLLNQISLLARLVSSLAPPNKLCQTALHLRHCDAFGAGLMFSSNQSEANSSLYFQGFLPFFNE